MSLAVAYLQFASTSVAHSNVCVLVPEGKAPVGLPFILVGGGPLAGGGLVGAVGGLLHPAAITSAAKAVPAFPTLGLYFLVLSAKRNLGPFGRTA